MAFFAVSHPSMTLFTTSQLCMQCLTGLTFVIRVAQELIFKHQYSTQQ